MGSSNITLYAKWTVNQYTITYNTNGGDTLTQHSVSFGATVTLKTASRAGYSFSGWYEDESLSIAFTNQTMPARNINLFAKWNINSYTISFESNGGSAVESSTQTYLSEVTEPSNPTRTGYTFEGWYTNTSLTNKYTFGTMGSSNITLYANWTVNQYTITYHIDQSTIEYVVLDFNTEIQYLNPTIDGFDFVSWHLDNNLNEAVNYEKMPAYDLTLYAEYVVEGLKYEIFTTYAVITDYLGSLEILSIPETIRGKKSNRSFND